MRPRAEKLQYQYHGGNETMRIVKHTPTISRRGRGTMTACGNCANSLVIWAGVCLLVVAGCSGGADQQLKVTGQVNWGGKPLSHGNITFKPVTTGSATGGVIENGVFTIPANRGVIPGTYMVTIEAYLPTGRQLPNSNKPGEMADELKQMIQAKYNQKTELRAEVRSDGDNDFTFELDQNKS